MTERSHVPTADHVARLFNANASHAGSGSDDHVYEDALEEVDFADLAQVRAEIDAIAQGTMKRNQGVHDAPEDMEEIDFGGLAAIRAQVKPQATFRDDVPEEVFTGVYSRSSHKSLSQAQKMIVIEDKIPSTSHPASVSSPPDTLKEEQANTQPLFVIDTTPPHLFTHRSASDVILVDRTGNGDILGDRDHDQDEERIVYVAPHPRSGRASPVPFAPRVKLPSTSILTGKSVIVEEGGMAMTSPVPICEEDEEGEGANGGPTIGKGKAGEDHLSLVAPSLGPATSPSLPDDPTQMHVKAVLRAYKKEASARRKRQRQHKHTRIGLRTAGVMTSEARLMENGAKQRRWEMRRRGDSDLDWGTEDEDKDATGVQEDDGVDPLSNGMDIDADLDLDANAMQGFLKSTSAEGSRFRTMDDIEDDVRMQREDEEGLGGPEGSSDSERSDDEGEREEEVDEEDAVFSMEEKMLIAESESEGELSPDSDDDELSPRSNFQARLRKARTRSRRRRSNIVQNISNDSEEKEEAPEIGPGIAARLNVSYALSCDHDHLAHKFQGYLDARNAEALLDEPEFTTPVQKKGKGKQLTGEFGPELQAQWNNDRTKKAKRKREREAARKRAKLDPLDAGNGKGKSKWEGNGKSKDKSKSKSKSKNKGNGNGNGNGKEASQKTTDGDVQPDPTTTVFTLVPRAIVDAVSLEAEMRRFVEEVKTRVKAGAGAGGSQGGGKTGDGAGPVRVMMPLPPMDKGMRMMVHDVAVMFKVKSVSRGHGEGRYTTLIGTSRTGLGVKEGGVKAVMKRYGGSGRGGGGKGGGGVPKHRDGEVVGKEAPKIGETNIGFRMLASMGWSEGNRIGGKASVGIETPLTAVIKNSKLGLGATSTR